MARGTSGRVVVEVDPALKRELYAALSLSGSTLKDWFVQAAEAYCMASIQGTLFDVSQSVESVAQRAEAGGVGTSSAGFTK